MKTQSTSTQSPQASPPPAYTVVPPTPTQRNETFMTRFIESVPGNSSSSSPPMTLPRLHIQPQPRSQPPPLSPTLKEGNVASPVRSNSVLSRRLRHGSLRLSPTTPIRSSSRDDHHTRSSSGTLPSPALPTELSQHPSQPQLPQISRISPIIPPSQLPALSTTGALSEVISTSIATHGHNPSTSSVVRKPIPDFGEDAPPSPGSIPSTGILPSLMLKHAHLERRIEEAINDFVHDPAPGSILTSQQHRLVGTTDKAESTSGVEPPLQARENVNRLSQPAREREASSQRSRRSDSPLSLSPSQKSASKHSQRSASQPMTLTTSHQLLERHPNQLFAMQNLDQQHNRSGVTTPRLSYASLHIDPALQAQHDRTPSGSIVLPPASESGAEALERSHYETSVHSIPQRPSSAAKQQLQTLHVTADTEDREGSRVALSSVSGSPRRSIPQHDSPEVDQVNPDYGSDRTTTPVPTRHSPQRRKRESVTAPQSQSVRNPSASPSAAAILQPMSLALGNLGDVSAMSYPSSQGRSPSGTHKSEASQPNPPPRRTLDSVRSQVAGEIAYRTAAKSNVVDGVRVGVTDASSAWSGPNDIAFIHLISSSLNSSFTLSSTPYLFIITATSFSPTSSLPSGPKRENGSASAPPTAGLLYITSSSRQITSRAVHLTCSKFIGRITSSSFTFSTPDVDVENAGDVSLGLATKELEWMARIKELHFSSFDSDVIHSILLTASRTPLDPTVPPPNSKSINILLEEARAQLTRITPRQALTQMRNSVMDVPTVLVDIRPQAQREEFGEIPGALIVERNVLEWRFDPRCESRLSVADRYDLRVIVFCQEGYTSSLAAQSLQQLGLLNATDMIGGYKAWKDARLPVELKPLRERSIVSAAGSIV